MVHDHCYDFPACLFAASALLASAHPDIFGYRAMTRLTSTESALPGPVWQIFLSNLYKALLMFNWDNGVSGFIQCPVRPALDVVTGALFVIGIVLLVVRYVRQRDWRDLLLLVSIPILLLPSVLSLAFPGENPSLNRTGGAAVAVFIVSALALDGFVSSLGADKKRVFIAYGLTGICYSPHLLFRIMTLSSISSMRISNWARGIHLKWAG